MTIRILVVDDEPGLLLTLVANLEDAGFVAEGAENATEALEMVRARDYDLVLSDIRMPGMTGVELFGQLKQLRPDLPVVLMTGFAIERQVEEAIGQGVFAVFPKPFDFAKAQRILESAARRPAVLVLVEGLPSSATTIASGLTTIGVKADGVGDRDQALSAMRSGPVDVCVLDLGAPKALAGETVVKVKAANPILSVIAITPTTGAPPETKVMRDLAALIKRPFRFKELLVEIAKARRKGLD